ncbi:MAG: hypothetical protein CMD23_03760 [Flavobacteriales bacterium]|nr:hypothetical protein [Flavobacteriales bacterium]
MKVTEHHSYVLIKLEKKTKIEDLLDFLERCDRNNSLIIDLLNANIPDNLIVSKLLPFHFIWQKTNNSFILVSNISKKMINDMVSIKTLEEALDFFHMEQLTRNI